MKRIILLADENSKRQLGSLLKILALLVLKLRGGKIADFKQLIDDNKEGARGFLELLGTNLEYFDELMDVMYKKSSTVKPHAEDFVKNLRGAMNMRDFRNNSEDITLRQRTILSPILTLVTSPDSSSAYSTLQNNIGNLGEPSISARYNAHFTETTDSSSKLSTKLSAAIQALTGRKGSHTITTEERAKFKGTEELKAIDKMRSELKAAVKQEIIKAVVASGEESMPIKELMETLSRNKVSPIPYPPEFRNTPFIHVNRDGLMTDMDGRVLKSQGIAPGSQIEVNKDYQPERGAKGKAWLYKITAPGAVAPQYIGTIDKAAAGRQKKFNRINEIITNDEMDRISNKWRNAMDLEEADTQEGMFPFLAEFLFLTSSRVGSGEGMTAGSRTYGASNFLVKHVNASNPNKIAISYPIKGGKKEKFILSAENLDGKDEVSIKKLMKFIRAKVEGKNPSDLVWTDNKGKRLSPTKFNQYLNTVGNMTAHNFRTLRGTKLAAELLPQAAERVEKLKAEAKKKGKKLSPQDVKKIFEETITNVGKALGHIRRTKDGDQQDTAATAIANYIDPQLMVDWFKQVGFAIPNNVAASAKNSGIEV